MMYVLPFPCGSACDFLENRGYYHVLPFCDLLCCCSVSISLLFLSFQSLNAGYSSGEDIIDRNLVTLGSSGAVRLASIRFAELLF